MAFTLAVGLAGTVALMAVTASDVTMWVEVICAAVITVATCAIQVYKMFRDKDNDKDDKSDDKDDKTPDDTSDDEGVNKDE